MDTFNRSGIDLSWFILSYSAKLQLRAISLHSARLAIRIDL